jgi:hypothetical protein
MPADALAPRRGRPRKFNTAARAVTLTLPETVIAALSAIDRDLSRAVVRVTPPKSAPQTHPPAELAKFGRRAVIVVNPTRTLEQRTGVFLVPLPDGRALISFDDSLTVARLELRIQDALEDGELSGEDRLILEAIGGLLVDGRRSGAVTVQQRNIIILESQAKSRRAGLAPAKRRR